MSSLDFFLFILQRLCSGIVNGLFYGGSIYAFPVGLLFVFLTTLYLVRSQRRKWKVMKRWKRIFSVLGIFASAISGLFVLRSFVRPNAITSDIHLWTWLNQTSVASTIFLHTNTFWGNLKGLLLAVSPSAFFQKVFINILGGNKWYYKGTDDITGRTWGFKKIKLKVPRLGNMYVKLGLTILCILIFTVKLHKKHKQEEIDQTVYTTILRYV